MVFVGLFYTETHKNLSPTVNCTDRKVQVFFDVVLYGREISAAQVFDPKSDTLFPTDD